MGKSQRQERRKKERRAHSNTVPSQKQKSAGKDEPEGDEHTARAMKSTGWPSQLLISLAITATIVIGGRWPRFFLNPLAVRHGRPYVELMVAIVIFLATSTLTAVIYCLFMATEHEGVKEFASAILNRAGVGATFGTLIGLRIAWILMDPSSDTRDTFPQYLSDVGNIITMLTICFVATAWPRIRVAARLATPVVLKRWRLTASLVPHSDRIAPLVVLVANAAGSYAAVYAWLVIKK